jgi:uncharacterized protein YjbI with pentapeptide repeats
MAADERWQEVRTLHRKHRFFYRISSGILVVAVGILLGGLLFPHNDEYLLSLYTNLLSIAVTVGVLDLLAQRREEARFRADLMSRMGSRLNHETIRAVEELRRHGWLDDGSLHGIDLYFANLQNANLSGVSLQRVILHNGNLQTALLNRADLRWANLSFANFTGANLTLVNAQYANLHHTQLREATLQEADLRNAGLNLANLQSASLREANLQNAHLPEAILQGALVWGANLQGASLRRANLENARMAGADLRGTDLRGASLKNAELQNKLFGSIKIDETTWLPDGGRWSTAVDMRCFTDPRHPQFWQQDWTDEDSDEAVNR